MNTKIEAEAAQLLHDHFHAHPERPDMPTPGNAIRAALERLLPQQREILELRFARELSFEEITQIMELNPITVPALCERSLTRLAKILAQSGTRVRRGRPRKQDGCASSNGTAKPSTAFRVRCPACGGRAANGINFGVSYRCSCCKSRFILRQDSEHGVIAELLPCMKRAGVVRDFGTEDDYTILGVRPSASPVELKAARNAFMTQYHPDKLPLTIGRALLDFATEIAKLGNAAYDRLSRARIR
jgi:DnaJ-domain-containing protein 1